MNQTQTPVETNFKCTVCRRMPAGNGRLVCYPCEAHQMDLPTEEQYVAIIGSGTLIHPGSNVYITGTGQTLSNVHVESQDCIDHGCSIHAPSDHVLAGFPTHWRPEKGLMERICAHGVGHPDPDAIAFVRRSPQWRNANHLSVHGCDGCCADDCS